MKIIFKLLNSRIWKEFQPIGFQIDAENMIDSINVCPNRGNNVKSSINNYCEYCGEKLKK